MTTTARNAAPKKAAAKRDPALCHYGAGSYGSPKTSKKCADRLVAGRQLCAKHEVAWKAEAKRRAAASKSVAKSAAKTVAKSPTRKVSKRAADADDVPQRRRALAPPQAPIARVPFVEPQPAVVQLVPPTK